MSPAPTIDNTLGALLMGALFSMMLWGVTCTQAYDYFMNNTDRRLQRMIVALLWVIDTFGSVLHAHIAYYFLVTTYGKPTSIQKSSWSLDSLSLVTGTQNCIIRCMFARRIYQFSEKNIIVTAWIVILSIGELVTSIVIAAEGFHGIDPLSKFKLAKHLYTSFSFGVTADLSVTVALCWLLHSSKSGFQKSDSVINVLMAYVVNTGLLVTVVGTVALITYITMTDNLIYVALFVLVTKLYLNAYLASLNAREKLRGTLHADSSIPLSRLRGSTPHARDARGVALSDEKSASFPGSTLAFSLEHTVERRGAGPDEIKTHHAV